MHCQETPYFCRNHKWTHIVHIPATKSLPQTVDEIITNHNTTVQKSDSGSTHHKVRVRSQ